MFTHLKSFKTNAWYVSQMPCQLAHMIVCIPMKGREKHAKTEGGGLGGKEGTLVDSGGKSVANVITNREIRPIHVEQLVNDSKWVLGTVG